MTKPTLANLTAFSTVAAHRSFRRAADALGVSRSSLSHAMLALERELGVRRLNRTTRSVAPTEAGEALLARLAPVLRDLDEALDAVADVRGDPSGTLRINANESAARLLLPPDIPCDIRLRPIEYESLRQLAELCILLHDSSAYDGMLNEHPR